MTRKKDIDAREKAEKEIPVDGEQEDAQQADTPEEVKAEEVGDGNGSGPAAEELPEPERLKQRIGELEDRLLRTAADFDNYRKRQARHYDDMVKAASDRVLTDLLEVVDNFRRALATAGDKGDVEAYRKGTEMIYDQMNGLLGKYDVTPIEAVGRPFDPNLHEALMQVPSEEYPEGTVAIEMSRGYKRGDRVLRHAKVGVSIGEPEPSEES